MQISGVLMSVRQLWVSVSLVVSACVLSACGGGGGDADAGPVAGGGSGGGTPIPITVTFGENIGDTPALTRFASIRQGYGQLDGFDHVSIDKGNGEFAHFVGRFGDLSVIPAGAVIENAQIELINSVPTYVSDFGSGMPVQMHRLLVSWMGEQEKVGRDASVTWDWRTSNDLTNISVLWTVPGALGDGTDRMAPVSTTVTLTGVAGAKNVATGAGLVADVQYMIDNPNSNFGWVFQIDPAYNAIADSTQKPYAEEAANGLRPRLIVTYHMP
jgi:hypothetical protein